MNDERRKLMEALHPYTKLHAETNSASVGPVADEIMNLHASLSMMMSEVLRRSEKTDKRLDELQKEIDYLNNERKSDRLQMDRVQTQVIKLKKEPEAADKKPEVFDVWIVATRNYQVGIYATYKLAIEARERHLLENVDLRVWVSRRSVNTR